MKIKTQIANQAVFNAAWIHIIAQDAPSMTSSGHCAYLGHKGRSCAFAPCIKDYDGYFEGMSARDLLQDHRNSLHEWALYCDLELAVNVQVAHDRNSDNPGFIKHFKTDMREIAKKYELTVPA